MRGEKILIIDDDESALELLRRRLEREGFSQIYTASDPEHGLEALRHKNPQQPRSRRIS